MPAPRFTPSVFRSRRRPTRAVSIGGVRVGGDEPIRVQSMTTTPTWDAEATIAQIQRLVDVGCEIVRVTVPTKRDAKALPVIREGLLKRGLAVPLVADIHFAPALALYCCDHVDKVRINPGNYVDSKHFVVQEYSDAEYAAELRRIEDSFGPLVQKAKALGIAMRIGTNHGSLSDRILNRYGDTPQGMVESALEFARICKAEGYHELVMSMKASNPIVMIQAYRLLAARMAEEGMDYPFHLGVTEAGDGLDARVKSAVGIGALLLDGIGDTIRVSLTEDPCAEVPVGFDLAKLTESIENHDDEDAPAWPVDPYLFERRASARAAVGDLAYGDKALPRIEVDIGARWQAEGFELEPSRAGEGIELVQARLSAPAVSPALRALHGQAQAMGARLSLALPHELWTAGPAALAEALALADRVELFGLTEADLPALAPWANANLAVTLRADGEAPVAAGVAALRAAGLEDILVAVPFEGLFGAGVARARRTVAALGAGGPPIILAWEAAGFDPVLAPASAMGALLCDGIGDALRVPARRAYDGVDRVEVCYTTLQATRFRTFRTEYVSCPSCGRTLFDLEETTARIKGLTGHLPNVKIAIMGCIVNGPGEMADADFGYVGWKPGKVDLYVGKEVVEKAVPEEQAPARLVELLKREGAWKEPEPAEAL